MTEAQKIVLNRLMNDESNGKLRYTSEDANDKFTATFWKGPYTIEVVIGKRGGIVSRKLRI